MHALPANTKIIIIEDEPSAAYLLRDLLFKLSFNNIMVFKDAKTGMENLKLLEPEILFLDIKLYGEYTGIDVLKYIDFHKIHTHIIITTAHINYSSEIIRFSPIDFLLKPIDLDELIVALNKISEHKQIHENPNLQAIERKNIELIEIHSNQEINYYLPKDVLYIEAEGSYSNIFLINGEKNTICQNLGKVAIYFPVNQFVRVGRKNIVNIQYIKKMCKKENVLILEYNGNQISIATSKKYLPKNFS